jgi:hypothetical protein
MLIKVANSDLILSTQNELSPERALSSPEITDRFKKLASEIKKVAPRSNEFLYFVARGIHAMEHAAIDPVTKKFSSALGHIANADDHGNCQVCGTETLKTASGRPISGLWCQSSQVEPWINQNGDAFPESELLREIVDPKDSTKTIKAFQTFIGKGLFTDHKSSEVENIRGIILDAAYDHEAKGVDLLIALDKVNYPELARQVSAGYSTQVSMGTQVNYSLCSSCGNKAVTEHDYCQHVASGKGLSRAGQKRIYEVNNGLNFIELSMVGNAADPRAKIKTIIAQAQNAKKNLENLSSTATESENQLILGSINRLENQISDLQTCLAKMAGESKTQEQLLTSEILNKIATLETQINEIGGRFMTQKTQEKKAYMQGTVEPDLKNSFEMADKNYKQYWEEDKHLHGEGMESGSEGLHPGYGLGSDEQVKKELLRANVLRARLEKHANPSKNRWTIFASEQPILSISAEEAYSDELSAPAEEAGFASNQAWFDDKAYAKNLIQAIKSLGLEKVSSTIQKAKTVRAQAAAPMEMPAEPAAPAMEAAPEVTTEPTPEVSEGIKAAAERIESAKDEILSLVDGLDGAAAEQGAELAGDLGQAGEELGDLGADMQAPMPAATASAYKRLVRYALNHAEELLTQAEGFVDAVTEQAEMEVTAGKKVNPGLQRFLDKKKKDKKKDKKDDKKKKDKKAFTTEELAIRKASRQAIASQLYDLTDGDMIAEAHPEGGNTTTFPGQEEGRIETVTEAQEKDMQAANSLPRGELVARVVARQRVIAAAEKVLFADAAEVAKKSTEVEQAQKATEQKKKELSDATKKMETPSTTAATKKAEVDKETKQYYKEEGASSATGQKSDPAVSQFYAQLTQDFAGKKSTAAAHDQGLKMKRAFAIAMKRASLGQIESTQEAIEVDVDRLMKLDDSSFVAFADVVENTKKTKATTATVAAQPQRQIRTAGALNIGVDQPAAETITDSLSKLPWRL